MHWKNWTRNLGAKILSLVIAVGVWFSVTQGIEFEQEIAFPIEYASTPEGLTPVQELPTAAIAKVRGKGKFLRFSLRDAAIKVDLAGSQAGVSTLMVSGANLQYQGEALVSRVEILEPRRIRVELDPLVIREVPITASVVGEPADGHVQVGKTFLNPAVATVKGPRKLVDAITLVATEEIEIEGQRGPLRKRFKVRETSASTVQVTPEVVEVGITVEPVETRWIENIALALGREIPENWEASLEPPTVAIEVSGAESYVEVAATQMTSLTLETGRVSRGKTQLRFSESRPKELVFLTARVEAPRDPPPEPDVPASNGGPPVMVPAALRGDEVTAAVPLPAGLAVLGLRPPSILLTVREKPADDSLARNTGESPLILGVETSCDETAAAVLDEDGRVLSNVIASQSVHELYGGVVPEIASREHVRRIGPVVRRSLEVASRDLEDVRAVAVTSGPGLVGALLVGVTWAKAFAWGRSLPLVGVNHLEGHVLSPLLEDPSLEPPLVVLVVSGGHTLLVRVDEGDRLEVMGRTRDDAAGEAFDKVAVMLGLGYPGGAALERLAADGDPAAFDFPRSRLEEGTLDFSFSGVKTAVRQALERDPERAKAPGAADVAASFQAAVLDVLVEKTLAAARRAGVTRVGLAGGVAANGPLRRALEAACTAHRLSLTVPRLAYCTDNAAMIAFVGARRLARGERADLTLDADPGLPLSGVPNRAPRRKKRP